MQSFENALVESVVTKLREQATAHRRDAEWARGMSGFCCRLIAENATAVGNRPGLPNKALGLCAKSPFIWVNERDAVAFARRWNEKVADNLHIEPVSLFMYHEGAAAAYDKLADEVTADQFR